MISAGEVTAALMKAGYNVEVYASASVQVVLEDGSRIHVGDFDASACALLDAKPDNPMGMVHVHHQGMPDLTSEADGLTTNQTNWFQETTVEGVLFRVLSMVEDPEAIL